MTRKERADFARRQPRDLIFDRPCRTPLDRYNGAYAFDGTVRRVDIPECKFPVVDTTPKPAWRVPWAVIAYAVIGLAIAWATVLAMGTAHL